MTLVERFRKATGVVERNGLAVELADARDPDGKQALVEAIRDASTKGARGSLFYALRIGEYPCQDQLPLLIEAICDGGYEEVCHAMEIVRRMGDVDVPVPNADALQAQLREALDRSDREGVHGDWRREAVEHILDCFEPDDTP